MGEPISLIDILCLILLGISIFLIFYVGNTSRKIGCCKIYSKGKNKENVVIGMVAGIIVISFTGTKFNPIFFFCSCWFDRHNV